MRTGVTAVMVLSTLVACGKSAGPGKDDETVELLAREATESLAAIKAGLPKADALLLLKCTPTVTLEELARSARHKALATELMQLCTAEVPLAVIRIAVEEAEAARKAASVDEVLPECFSEDVTLGSNVLKTAGKLELARDLLARFKAACPDAP